MTVPEPTPRSRTMQAPIRTTNTAQSTRLPGPLHTRFLSAGDVASSYTDAKKAGFTVFKKIGKGEYERQ